MEENSRKELIKRIKAQFNRHDFYRCGTVTAEDGKVRVCISWANNATNERMKNLMQKMGYNCVRTQVEHISPSSKEYSAMHIFTKRTEYRITSIGEYKGELKELAKRVKENEAQAIEIAAGLLAPYIPENAQLIPMPGRTGESTYTCRICELIAERTGATVTDVLTCGKHESLCTIKRENQPLPHPEELMMSLRQPLLFNMPKVIIDNVVASRTTAVAALNLVGDATVLALAENTKCNKINLNI